MLVFLEVIGGAALAVTIIVGINWLLNNVYIKKDDDK